MTPRAHSRSYRPRVVTSVPDAHGPGVTFALLTCIGSSIRRLLSEPSVSLSVHNSEDFLLDRSQDLAELLRCFGHAPEDVITIHLDNAEIGRLAFNFPAFSKTHTLGLDHPKHCGPAIAAAEAFWQRYRSHDAAKAAVQDPLAGARP